MMALTAFDEGLPQRDITIETRQQARPEAAPVDVEAIVIQTFYEHLFAPLDPDLLAVLWDCHSRHVRTTSCAWA